MKEFGFTMDGIDKGLRLREKARKDDQSLEVCYNLVPKIEGLVPLPSISELITSQSASHPFPQIFFGDSFWLLCFETSIYIINPDWTVTLALDLSPYYGTFPAAPKGVWDFEDFFDYVVLTNGGVTVLYNTQTAQWEYNDGAILPTLGSLCNYSGQLFGLGVETVSGDSKTIFQGTDERFVMWGEIGAVNFIIDKSNTIGNRALVGEQYRVKVLGEFVVVYGARQITILKPDGVNWGVHRTYKYGIANRGAMGGDDKNHVFIDTFGNFYHIDAELKVTGPYYKEFFSQMLGNDIIVQHSELDNEFYITDGVVAFIRTNEGLGETSKGWTGIAILGANRVGIATDFNDDTSYFTTNIQSFGTPANKTTSVVEVDCKADASVYVAIESRHTREDPFVSSDWVQINPAGAAKITMNGVDFKIKVKCDDTSFDPDYLVVRVNFDDRRFIRGISNAGTTDRRTD